MKFWFDEGLKIGLTHRNMHARLNQLTDAWSVKEADLKTQQNLLGISPGYVFLEFSFCTFEQIHGTDSFSSLFVRWVGLG